jgi:hypothetical protein
MVNEEFTSSVKPLKYFYFRKLARLIYFLYDEGYTTEEVADVLKIRQPNLVVDFPLSKTARKYYTVQDAFPLIF